MPKIKIHYFSADAPRLKMTDKIGRASWERV